MNTIRRLIYALSREDIRFDYNKSVNDIDQGITEYRIMAKTKNGQELGYIEFSVRPIKTGTDIYIYMLKNKQPQLKNTKFFIYLLEEFKRFLDTQNNPSVRAQIDHPELEDWLNKYVHRYNINFTNQNPLKGMDAVIPYINDVIRECASIDYHVHEDKDIEFEISFSIEQIESTFLETVSIGNPKRFKQYLDHAIEDIKVEDCIDLLGTKYIRSVIEIYFDMKGIEVDSMMILNYLYEINASDLSISKSSTDYIIKFNISLPNPQKVSVPVTASIKRLAGRSQTITFLRSLINMGLHEASKLIEKKYQMQSMINNGSNAVIKTFFDGTGKEIVLEADDTSEVYKVTYNGDFHIKFEKGQPEQIF